MKAFVLSLLLACSNVFALDACFTGSWKGENLYEGVNIEALEHTTVLYWYTYSFFDRDEQNWLLFEGDANDLVAYDTIPFGFEPILYEVGDGAIDVIDNNHIIFSYDLILDLDVADPQTVTPWCLTNLCEGSVELVRITQPIPCAEDQ